MDTAFIIGNGESRNIFPIENLKGKGVIYGCNAIYRDHPMLCDHIVAVNPPMYEELAAWHNNGKESPKIYGRDDVSKWDYICDGDTETDVPEGLKIYRVWRGGDIKKGGNIKTNDFIDQQPYAGSLFKSQNNSTWTTDQMKDLKMTINRCKFTTGTAANVVFENDSYSAESLTNNPISIGNHCFGCTAGAGSSCGGELN